MITVKDSLIMLRICEMISRNKDKTIYLYEPDDRIDNYIDFLEQFPDWGNDHTLYMLIESLFKRKRIYIQLQEILD